jgi:hypothetical protein
MRRLAGRPGLAVLLIAAALLAGCGGGDGGGGPSGGVYSNDEVRYEFTYPKAWQDVSDKVKLQISEGSPDQLDHVAVGEFNSELGLLSGVQVTVVRLNKQIALEALETELLAMDASFTRLASTVAGKQATPEFGELGGLKARQYVIEFVYTAANQQVQVASAQTITFFGDRQYTVNCQAPVNDFDSKVRAGCEQVLGSLRFK